MKIVVTLLALLGLAAIFVGWGAWRFYRVTHGTVARVQAQPQAGARTDLPSEVAAYLARALGQTRPAPALRLTQSASMELKLGLGWKPLSATQVIGAGRAGFAWIAQQGIMRVLDSYADGRGLLEVRLFAAIRIARATGADVDRAEVMRYLAELPWAPDAIALNRALEWQVHDPEHWTVRLNDVAVQFRLEKGDVVEVTARNRPAIEAGKTVLRDWRGVFGDHRETCGRRIPHQGEVGYMIDGSFAPYFKGRIIGCAPVATAGP